MDPREAGLWDDNPAPAPKPEEKQEHPDWDPGEADKRTVVVVRFDALNPQGVLEHAFTGERAEGVSAEQAAKAYRRALEKKAREPGTYFHGAGAVFKVYHILEEE